MSHGFDSKFRIGIGALAGGEETFLTKPAMAAADRERDNDPIALFEVCYASAPTSTTIPMFSCPKMSPLFIVG